MKTFRPKTIYYEKEILDYESGKHIFDKYQGQDIEFIEIENHNNIPCLRQEPDKNFPKLKRNLILGVRKSLRPVPNHKTSDFLMPYTSSGCSAMCIYCYLVCTYFKCSYLRVFVNREKMIDSIIKRTLKENRKIVYEIGSNSDLVMENMVSDNLPWTIEQFARIPNAYATLPTKFHQIDSILELDHKGKTTVRMSLNPSIIIDKYEIGTSSLNERMEAIEKLWQSGYKIGILIAPVILVDRWRDMYHELFTYMRNKLSKDLLKDTTIEVILMTYGYAHRQINEAAFRPELQLYDDKQMTGRGRGKYCYKQDIRECAKEFISKELNEILPMSNVAYIV